jgi:integrase
MPAKTDIEKRDRTIIAFVIMTGVRDNAIASVCMKHVDLEKSIVVLWAVSANAPTRNHFGPSERTGYPINQGIACTNKQVRSV